MPETIIAMLKGGPLGKRRVDAEIVEGRPPMTLDLEADDGGGTCRYCLEELVQSGESAAYTFLYRI
jgi:hypothetical protein